MVVIVVVVVIVVDFIVVVGNCVLLLLLLLLMLLLLLLLVVFQQNCNKANFSTRCILLSATQHTYAHTYRRRALQGTHTERKLQLLPRRKLLVNFKTKNFLYTFFTFVGCQFVQRLGSDSIIV